MWKHDPDRSRDVRCGKCPSCMENKLKEWYVRMLCELPKYKNHSFITLTYSDECLPFDKSVSKPELQKFFKRFRKNNKAKIAYYACGEYGEKNQRAHYHIILYYDDVDDIKKAVEQSWTLGRVDIGTVTPASIRYCLNYVHKQVVTVIGCYKVAKPFQLMSKGIGKTYIESNEKRLSQLGYINIKGVKYSLPRYFEKKSELIKSKNDERRFLAEQSVAKKSLKEVERIIREEPEKNKQVERNIIAKKNLKKRKGV